MKKVFGLVVFVVAVLSAAIAAAETLTTTMGVIAYNDREMMKFAGDQWILYNNDNPKIAALAAGMAIRIPEGTKCQVLYVADRETGCVAMKVEGTSGIWFLNRRFLK